MKYVIYLNPTYYAVIAVEEIEGKVNRYAAVHVPGGTATSASQLMYFTNAEST